MFLYQSEWQDVAYPLWDVPDRILVSMDVTNRDGVSYSYIAVDT